MSTPNPLDRIITPHDGLIDEIDDAEKLAAVEAFRSVVDSMMLRYASAVHVYRYGGTAPSTELFLTLPLTPASSLDITIRARETVPASDDLEREIALSQFVNSRFMRSHTYKFTPGTLEVVRSDEIPIVEFYETDESKRQRAELLAMSDDELGEVVSALLRGSAEIRRREQEGQKLDRQMGFNHLPVHLAEVEAVGELVDEALPRDR